MSTLSPCHLLSTLVWDLREKLNTLVYRLETQALMVAASRTQHIGRSSDEVERATDEVTRLESKLMSAAAEAAAEHGFEKPCSFQELAEACDAEHDFCLSEHRQALVMLGEVVSELVVTNKEIARNLDIQEVTVKLHVKNIFSKLGVSNKTQAALFAKERYLL